MEIIIRHIHAYGQLDRYQFILLEIVSSTTFYDQNSFKFVDVQKYMYIQVFLFAVTKSAGSKIKEWK